MSDCLLLYVAAVEVQCLDPRLQNGNILILPFLLLIIPDVPLQRETLIYWFFGYPELQFILEKEDKCPDLLPVFK